MTEAQLFEALGRKQSQLESQDAAYTELLNVLSGVVLGAIDVSRVLVNQTDRTWEVSKPGTRPSLPATINGLPACVVAPDPVDNGG